MKKTFKTLALLAIGACLVGTSCKKDKDPVEETPQEQVSVNKNKTAEQQKEDIETYSVDAVSELEGLKETDGMQALMALLDMLMSSDSNGGLAIKSIAQADPKKSLKAMEEEGVDIVAEFDDVAGTYSWNATTEEFDFVAGSGSIIFKFPSEETSTTNDAKVAISGLLTEEILIDNQTQEIPTAITMKLMVGTTEAVKYTYSATVSNNFVSSATNSFQIDSYKLSASIAYTDSKMTQSVNFTSGGKTVMAHKFTVEGNLATYRTMSFDTEEIATEDITKASVSFQFFEIIATGTADITALNTESEKVDYGPDAVAIINDNVDVSVKYTDGTQIATGEAFWDTEIDDIDVNLSFKDGSKATVEAYLEDNLADFTAELDKLFE